jgi:hypothetical protein
MRPGVAIAAVGGEHFSADARRTDVFVGYHRMLLQRREWPRSETIQYGEPCPLGQHAKPVVLVAMTHRAHQRRWSE